MFRISRQAKNVEQYGELRWESVDHRIQDIMIDLVYRGDYVVDTRRFIQRPFIENDIESVRSALRDKNNWVQRNVPSERLRQRVEYLK